MNDEAPTNRPFRTSRDALIHDARETIEKLQLELEALPAAIQAAVGDVPAAIREASSAAVANLEKCAEAQAYWIEQETLKDRDAFIARQQEVNASFVAAMKAEMSAVIAVQNTALESVLLRVGALTTEAIKREVAASVAAAAAGIAADAKKAAAQPGLGTGGVMLVGAACAMTGMILLGSVLVVAKVFHM